MTPFDILKKPAVRVRKVYTELHLARNMLNFFLVIPGVAVPTMKVPASGLGLPPLCLDQLVSIPKILSQNLFQHRVQRGIDEPLIECQNILHHAAVTFCSTITPEAGA